MVKQYQHTQIGYSYIILLVIPLLFLVYSMTVYGFNWITFSVMIIIGVVLVLHATLTVVIEEDVLRIRFGPGVVRKDFSLKDVESCHVVKNPWYYGWGHRLTPRGRLYNVSGFHAVEIEMKTGKKYRIGTDVPNDLETAIRQSMASTVR